MNSGILSLKENEYILKENLEKLYKENKPLLVRFLNSKTFSSFGINRLNQIRMKYKVKKYLLTIDNLEEGFTEEFYINAFDDKTAIIYIKNEYNLNTKGFNFDLKEVITKYRDIPLN